jgi:predicted  nucleic acid-binding Zn-ribbon protein
MIAPGNRVAAPQVSNPSRAGIYGKDGIRANENFNGDVMEELRRVKLALDAEVSQRVKLQERILDILPQMDSFDEALSATNRKVEELRKTMGDDRHRKDLLRQHGHELTTIGNAVNKIFSTLDHVTADVTALQRQSVVIKEENSDSVQSINSKLTAEIEVAEDHSEGNFGCKLIGAALSRGPQENLGNDFTNPISRE